MIEMKDGQFLYERRVMTGEYTAYRGDTRVVQREDWLAVTGRREGLALTGPRPPPRPVSTRTRRPRSTWPCPAARTTANCGNCPPTPGNCSRTSTGRRKDRDRPRGGGVRVHLRRAGTGRPGPRPQRALYRAARRIPGVVVETGVRDRIGRTGTGLALSSSGSTRPALVFDASSYVFLGVEGTTALLEIGVADRAGEPPVDSWNLGTG
ncbi:hypothetical protein ID867_21845 [Streptomyces parvulus]|nr:hypothetical protein [Streptomyces parvulus]